jgi:hypothetical protein
MEDIIKDGKFAKSAGPKGVENKSLLSFKPCIKYYETGYVSVSISEGRLITR